MITTASFIPRLKCWLAERCRPFRLAAAYNLVRHGALIKYGWIESRRKGLAVDAQGRPIPWYTYPALRFLEERAPTDVDVLEYGCGYSTLWWMSRSKSVTAVESVDAWANTIRPLVQANTVILTVSSNPGLYALAAEPLKRRFDIIVIDGDVRNSCAERVPFNISDRGVVIWDNSDRDEYSEGLFILKNLGYRRLDFFGMGPINTYEWTTSVLYKDDNILGL